MALVEPRLLESLQLRNHPQFGPAFHPMVTAMNTLDQEMENVLSRGDMSMDDKVKMYNQVLQRYGTYKDQQEMTVRAPMPVQIVANPTEITPEHSGRQCARAHEKESTVAGQSHQKQSSSSLDRRWKTRLQGAGGFQFQRGGSGE